MEARELRERYRKFSAKSLAWCIEESDRSVNYISDAIQKLMQNAERVSRLSEDSATAMQSLNSELKDHLGNPKKRNIESLLQNLKKISVNHSEIAQVIDPIMHSLQFQDRLRQNLENIDKMIAYWAESDKKDPAIDFQTFGEKLLKMTTMSEERDIIRANIDGLPPEEVADSVQLF